jgi:signal transduction histidine kinase
MGMGLFISQKILTYFNGRIEFYSELGKGSTFKFWFDMKNATLSYSNTYIQDYDNDSSVPKMNHEVIGSYRNGG